MSLVPVMDIKQGKVVMGDQGERNTYQPVDSDIVDSANPEEVLEAFNQHYNFNAIYIADIDSLEEYGDNIDTLRRISQSFDKEVMLDCGFSDYESFDSEILSFVDKFIVPTESLESLNELRKLVEKHPDSEFVVSIDLDQEGFISKIDEGDVHSFLTDVMDLGITEAVLLDITQVGTEEGPSKQVVEIAEEIEEDFKVVSGGGVRNREDYREFLKNGVDKVLVATSLHKQNFKSESS